MTTVLHWYHINFYPRSPCGERQLLLSSPKIQPDFYPRSPCGERLHEALHRRRFLPISIHALLAESDGESNCAYLPGCISIHALLAESDLHACPASSRRPYFYPRSPCGERRSAAPLQAGCMDFYPRSPCGERPKGPTPAPTAAYFYPRSPCGERRLSKLSRHFLIPFLSTLSLRRATAKVHKTVGHFCAYGTNFMGIASSC